MRGLVKKSPFPQRPLVWASPPPRGAGVPSSVIAPPGGPLSEEINASQTTAIRQAMTSASFAFSYNTGTITAAFPSATRVSRLPFITPIGLISVELATSLLNASSDGILAVFIAKDVGTSLSASQNGDIYVSHLVEAGLSHSMRSGMAFSDDISPRFGSGEALAVYLSAAGTGSAADRASGVITVRYFNET